ncbi:ABC transporter permease [Thermodesulfobacteriota bacterium]
MKPSNVFQLELATVLANKQALMMKFGFTLLLGFTLVLIGMPLKMRISGFLIFLLFSSFFGAAVSMLHRRSDGHITRLKLLPLSFWSILVDFLLAGAVVDFLQMGILIALFIFVHGSGVHIGLIMTIAGLLAATVFMLNLAGIILGFLLKNNPEVHLFGALSVGIIAFISGLFPVPERIAPILDPIIAWNPLSYLMKVLTAAAVPQSNNSDHSFYWILVVIFVTLIILLRTIGWKWIFPSMKGSKSRDHVIKENTYEPAD